MNTIQLNIPAYAQDMLWLTGGHDFQIPVSARKEFDAPQEALTLRWGTPQGSPLMQWQDSPAVFTWDGHVAVNGHVEASHVMTVGDLELMIIELTGHLMMQDARRLPSLADLRRAPFERDVFTEKREKDYWYAFLLPLESPLSDFAHHALVNGQALDCYGSLADAQIGFQQVVGMPLLLKSLTLYS